MPDVSIAEVKFPDHPDIRPEMQKTISGNLGYHAVRLDVYLDDGKTVINVEMQTGNKANLPKRVRYYSAMLDHDQLEKSKDYELLKPTYVIFICTYDPFERDRYCYAFENICMDEDGLKLNDGSYKMFFNTAGHKGEISEEHKDLLAYFRDPEHAARSTDLTRDLDRIVDEANHDADWRREHMTYELLELDAEKRGETRGKQLMSKLMTILFQQGKINEAQHVASDEAYCNQLLKEYGLA